MVLRRFTAEGEYVLTGTKKYLYLTDHLGSVRELVDITGTPTLVGSFDYTPYGAVARAWGTVTPGYTYAGLFAHPATGLLLSATRAYDPAKGRFLNRDPKKERAAGENQFAYTLANPVRWNDPTGLDVIIAVGVDPLTGYPHGLIIITSPGSDNIIGRQVFWDGFGGGVYDSPPYSGNFAPENIQHLDRIVTDEAENKIALDYVLSKQGTHEPYKFQVSDCNSHALATFSEIQKRIGEYRNAIQEPALPPIGLMPVSP